MTEKNVSLVPLVSPALTGGDVLPAAGAMPLEDMDPKLVAEEAKARLEAAVKKRFDLMTEEAHSQGLPSYEHPLFKRTLDVAQPVTQARQAVWEAHGLYLRYAAWLEEPQQY